MATGHPQVIVAARYSGRSPADGLRFAVACGAESTLHFGAGVLDPHEAERLMDEVTVEELSAPAFDEIS